MEKIDRKKIENILALTSTQEGMLFHYLKNPGGTQYFEQLCLELSGPIDRDCFEQAWNAVIDTNEMLRTVFRWEKTEHPMQIVLKEHTLKPVYYDLTGGDSHRVKEQLEMVKTKDRNEKFHLEDVPFRVILCRHNDAKYSMIISNHHILYDGWSSGIILQEFFNAYGALLSGRAPEKPVKTRFQEFIKWRQSRDSREAGVSWRNYLGGLDSPTVFSFKQRKSRGPAALRTQTYRLECPGELARGMEEFAKAHRLTPAAVLYCAWGILLQKYNNSNDVVFGTTVSGRRADVAGIEEMVGLFINTVPLRVCALPHERILDLLLRIHQALQERTPHENTPLVEIKEYSELSAGVPLFDSLVVIENYPLDRRLKPGPGKIDILSYSTWEETNYDVTLGITTAGNIIIDVIYDNETCAGEIIERLAHHYQNLIRYMVMKPGETLHDMEMLTEAEKRQLLRDFNDIGPAYPEDKTPWELFSVQAAKTPGYIALVGHSEKPSPDSFPRILPPGRKVHRGTVFLAYRELSESAEGLAYYLLQGGVRPGGRVGLLVDRGLEMFTGILGILMAGCAYVPLNPKAPAERTRYMLVDSQAEALVTAGSLAPGDENLCGWHGKKFLLEDIPLPPAANKSLDPGQRGLTNLLPVYIIYTSGSTGKPKGVPITHANLSPLLHWGYDVLGFDSTDRWVQNLSYYFDWSVWEIFMALTTGGSLHAVSEDLLLDPARYIDYITREKITVLHITPTHFQSLVHRGRKLGGLKYLCIGAEKLSEDLAKRSFESVDEGCRVFNMYGPTEATIISAVLEIDPLHLPSYKELSGVPIGKTVGNTKLSILDWGLKPCPLYVPGELHIGGTALAWGYLNNPELTAEKFINKSFSGGEGGRFFKKAPLLYKTGDPAARGAYKSNILYRTGDLARWLPDGTVEFLGRIDFQLKIRGFRVEPGEIEKHLLEHREVKEALVTAGEYENGDKYLCAYVVPQPGFTSELSKTLKEYLSGFLPDYMVPAYFVRLDRMPLNPNGKVDLKALPGPMVTSAGGYIAPGNDKERALVEIWARVLGLDASDIGIDDDFFRLGGHSLNVTAVIGSIYKKLKIEVPFIGIFVNSTVRELARYIGREQECRYSEIHLVEEKEYYPLSPAQRRLFVLQQMETDCNAYNIHGSWELDGVVDKERLGEVFVRLIARHESLRTSFELIDEEPVQRIHKGVEFEIEYYDLAEDTEDTERKKYKLQNTNYKQIPNPKSQITNKSEGVIHREKSPLGPKGLNTDVNQEPKSQELRAKSYIKNFIRPFDLSRAPLLRAGLIERTGSGPGHAILMVDLHHIIADGASVEVFIKEFSALYGGGGLPKPHLRYKDFARWFNERNKGEALRLQKSYWLKQLEGEVPSLNLPTDFARPVVGSFAGGHHGFKIHREETRALKNAALAENTTLYGILAAAFTIFLSKLSGQEDIIIGTPVLGRKHMYEDLAHIIGMFVNTLALRHIPCGEKRVSDYIKEVGKQTAEAYENQEYPFEELVENVVIARDPGRNPLFDVMFAMQNLDIEKIQMPGLVLESYLFDDRIAKFDLVFICEPAGDQLLFTVEYRSTIFAKETIKRYVNYFRKVLSEVGGDREKRIGDLEIITAEEKEEILYRFNRFEPGYRKDKTIPQLFEEQVRRTPHQVALTGPKLQMALTPRVRPVRPVSLTYHELNERSGGLAGWLIEKGVQPDMIVGIMMERSVDMIVGIFGILAAGGAYMPIDPNYPAERTDYMLKDSGAVVLLTARAVEESLNRSHISPAVKNRLPAISLAYVIYTSGSTGNPKGVMIEHHSVINRLNWMQGAYPIGPGDVILQKTPVVFDVSVWELFWWSFRGAGLCQLGPGEEKDPGAIAAASGRFRITTMHFVPSMLNAFLFYFESLPDIEKELKKLSSLKQVFSSGEALAAGQVERFYRLFGTGVPPKLINLYGPTEATVDVSYFQCIYGVKPEKVPIGKPIANIRLYVLDRELHHQPVGITGELYIAGVGLARGYINNPGLTSEKFCLRRPGGSFRENLYRFPAPRGLDPGKNVLLNHSPLTTHHSPIYRTGDLARWLDDGNIEYLGRIDHQVKIRGFRIELEEIESLLKAPGNLAVKEAVVVARPDAAGDDRLIAYIVPDKKYAFTVFRQLELGEREFPGNEMLYHWPNRMPVYYLNRMETDFMYKEIFEDRSYLKHGITLKAGSCVFDVGANIGVFSLFVNRHCKNARVYSFEPLPPVYRVLALNTSLYDGDFKTFNYGIGAGEGEAVFTYYPHATILSGRSSNQEQTAGIVKAFLSRQGEAFSEDGDGEKNPAALEEMYNQLLAERLTTAAYTCRIKSLSRVIEENGIGVIDLLKIDVEKAEWEVLSGIREEHWPLVRQLVIEVHEAAGGSSVLLPEITRLLENKGYRIAVEQEQLLENTRLYNLYAVRSTGEEEEIEETGEPLRESSRYCVEDLIQETRDYLISRLPEYMVPTHIVPLARLPLTTSGKVDRKALPSPLFTPGGKIGRTYTPPRSTLEKKLVEIWSHILGIRQDSIGIDDNFFELGGHSLKALQLLGRIHKESDVEIPLARLFETPTIRGLADGIREMRKSYFTSIEPVEEKEYYELAPFQKRFLVIWQFKPDDISYNISEVMELEGLLSREKFEQTFKQLIRRHESLRTSFHLLEGEPVQRIHTGVDFEVEFLEVEATGSGMPEAITRSYLRPFDLTRAPLLRVALGEIAAGKYYLMFALHHIVSDGVSIGVLIKDSLALYTGEELPPLKIRYRDFVEWRKKKSIKTAARKTESQYRETLLNLPLDFPRPSLPDFKGRTIRFEPGELDTALKVLSRQEDATLYMVLLAAFNVFLARLTGQENIVVGSPMAGRQHPDLEGIIGLFINPLALQNFPRGHKPFPEFLKEVKTNALDAFEKQDYQYDELIEKMVSSREAGRNPLYDVMLVLQNMEIPGIEIPGLKVTQGVGENLTSKFDMTLYYLQDHSIFALEYMTALFKEETIRRFIRYFEKVLEQIVENPRKTIAEIEIIPPEEKRQILYEFNETAAAYPRDKCIYRSIEDQVEKTPGDIAAIRPRAGEETEAISSDISLTYRELNEKSNRLASILRARGVKGNRVVGIMIRRSLEMLEGILGILKAGGAYLPIDPGYPANRITHMLENSGATLLLTERENPVSALGVEAVYMDQASEGGEKAAAGNLEPYSGPDDLIYIIFTSGSTGIPKGAGVKQRGFANLVHWFVTEFGLGGQDRNLLLTSMSFDLTQKNFYAPLISGGCLCIPGIGYFDPRVLLGLIRENGVTWINCTPSMFYKIVERENLSREKRLLTLRYVFLGGEPISMAALIDWLESGDCRAEIVNTYGPTECTDISNFYRVKEPRRFLQEVVPLGKGVANVHLYILDKNLQLQPVGIPGELCIGGEGVGIGYVNDEPLTARKFIRHSFEAGQPGEWLYRTGDLVKWQADGNVEFLGRMDHQVKIRGYRIELGEIENRLLTHPKVKEAVVLARESGAGDKYLCAYIVPNFTASFDVVELREHLARELPEYMRPAYFVVMEKMPLNPNGKVDRKALPEPEWAAGQDYVPPQNEVEMLLAEIWAEVLGVKKEKVGIHDNFFQSGGHSLKATALVGKIHKTFAVEVTIAELFKSPTIKGIARFIGQSGESHYGSIRPVEKKRYYPLSSAQKRLYVIQQLDLESTAYNIPAVMELEGELDREAFGGSFSQLVARHESLRTSFEIIEDEPVQEIHEEVAFEIENYDLPQSKAFAGVQAPRRGVPIKVFSKKAPWPPEAIIKSFIRPFDLSQAPLFRVGLIKTGSHRHILMVDIHHIAADGISFGILVREFMNLYTGEEMPGLKLRYRDYSEWQRREKERGAFDRQETYWKEQLSGELPVLDLPADFPRPSKQVFEGSEESFEIGKEELAAIKALAMKEGATLFMVSMAIYIILLSKLSGQEEIIVGTPTAGRMHPDLEPIIGMFVNTLVLRNYPCGEKYFPGFLKEVKARSLEAFEFQEYPYEDIVEQVMEGTGRDAGRNPLFDTMFVIQNADIPAVGEAGLSIRPLRNRGQTAKFDLLLVGEEIGEKLSFTISYSSRLFTGSTIRRFIGYYKKIIDTLLESPGIKLGEIEIISGEEKQRILGEFNDTGREYPKDKTIHELFKEEAERVPDSIALVGTKLQNTKYKLQTNSKPQITNNKQSGALRADFDVFGEPAAPDNDPVQPVRPVSLTYHELNLKSHRLAGLLIEKGVQPDTIVGIMIERSVEMMVGILGILKAGGAYMPIDPDYPQERIDFMLKDTSARILLTANEIDSLSTGCVLTPGSFLYSSEGRPFTSRHSSFSTHHSSTLAYVIYTSGSTGKPKGVMVEHRNVVRLVKNTDYVEFKGGQRMLPTGALEFDASTFEIWGGVLNGLTLYLLEKGEVLDPGRLKESIKKYHISTIWMTSPLFNQMVQADEEIFGGLTYLLVGGDALSSFHISRVRKRFPALKVINGYGPTENTTFSTTFLIEQEYEGSIPIGRPISNSTAYIVNRDFHVQPVGVRGELYVGGDGVSRGYLNDPGLTAEKFCLRRPGARKSFLLYLPEGHLHLRAKSQEPRAKFYKTGDLARWLEDGNIEFLGRQDQQVKLRGFRVEPGEVENRLLRHKGIKDAVVLVKENQNKEKYLCAYVVPVSGSRLAGVDSIGEELRSYLEGTLPHYMVPAYFIQLDRLPLTPNGKIDRKALPEPESTGVAAEESPIVAPRNLIEEKLTLLWSEILSIPFSRLSVDSDFFRLGGHSLKAISLVGKIHKVFSVEVPVTELFQRPTIEGIARYIEQGGKSHYWSIRPVEKKRYYPLSSAQKRLYVIQQLDLQSTAYNIPAVMELEGELDREAFGGSFSQLVDRHESLRTSFEIIEDEPVQEIHEEVAFEIENYDLTQSKVFGSPEPFFQKGFWPPEAIIKSFIRPFDLSQAPLFRVGLIKTGSHRHILMVDIHHIAADGISFGILVREFMHLYTGEEMPGLKLRYRDYSEWQRREKERGALGRQETYWKEQLSGELPVLDLPTDFPRPSKQVFEGSEESFEIGKEELAAIKALAMKEGATLFMVSMAIYIILLSKLSGQEEIIVGTPTAGRMHPDLEPIIGMFVNTLVLRNYPCGEKYFPGFLKEVKARSLEAFEFQEYPYEDLVEQVMEGTGRDASRNPLFDTMFVIQNAEIPAVGEAGLSIRPLRNRGKTAKFDLLLVGEEIGEKLSFTISYSTRLFTGSTIRGFIGYYKRIVETLLEKPGIKLGEIEIISGEERQRILGEFNDTGREYPKDKTIHELFLEQEQRVPDSIALVGTKLQNTKYKLQTNSKPQITNNKQSGALRADFDVFSEPAAPDNDPVRPVRPVSLTYHELNLKSDRLAGWLIEKGVQPGTIVGIMMGRSLELVIGILGILKAGAAYLPINPKNPGERIKYLLADSGAKILLTASDIESVINRPDWSYMSYEDEKISADSLAYVIYTSGSTGKPKGVPIAHANFSPLLHWGYSRLGLNRGEHVIQNLSYYFDWSVWEIFITLTTGSSLYLTAEEVLLNPAAFLEFMRRNDITVLHITPTQFRSLAQEAIETGQGLKSLKHLYIGAEQLTYDQVESSFALIGEKCRLFNMYGPTEATIMAAVLELHRFDYEKYKSLPGIPIGKPIANAHLLVLDKHLGMCPVNITGELYIGGEGIAAGYLNNVELTAERFINYPFTLYRTGDLARWDMEGNIEFLGREDFQVKIRGFRIEAGEIEKRILGHEKIKQAAVMVIENREGGGGVDKSLCAYVVADKDLDIAEAKKYLSGELPDYMVPPYWVILDRLPLNPNGKIDRRALPAPEMAGAPRAYTAPRSEIERKLVEIWQQLIKIKKIGVHDDFFAAGGHSLKVLNLVNAIQKEFKVKINFQDIFRYSTIAALSDLIRQSERRGGGKIENQSGKEYYHLSYTQKRLWMLYQLEPGNPAFNLPSRFTLHGRVEEAAVQKALEKLVQRHESFRTYFPSFKGGVVQRILSHLRVHLDTYDLSGLGPQARDEKREGLFKEEGLLPFNLETPPLFRVKMIRCSNEETDLILTMHHIITDGWSMEVLKEEFKCLYESYKTGGPCSLEPLRVRYIDYVYWQEELLADREEMQGAREFWEKQLQGEHPVPDLPYDFPKKNMQSKKSAAYGLVIPAEVMSDLEKIARERKASLFMVLLAGFNLLLYRLTGQEDILLAVPGAARQHEDLKNIVGFFVNTLLLREKINPGETFIDFLSRVQHHTLQVLEYQGFPIELLCSECKIRYPEIPVFFNMVNVGDTEREELRCEPGYHLEMVQEAKFDMVCYLAEFKNGIRIETHYYRELFAPRTIEKIMQLYRVILEDICRDPGKKIGEYQYSLTQRKRKLAHFI